LTASKARIRQIEQKLKDHKSLSDEFERPQSAPSRLEGVMRPRTNAGRRGQRPATQPKRAVAPKKSSAVKSNNARAPRGQNEAKILESLTGAPRLPRGPKGNRYQHRDRQRGSQQDGEGR
jgi:hypothetical protein